jgi:uncharacterized peroxidase-related enzyme
MTTYVFHSADSAPSAARPILAAAQQKLGFVPNLYAGLANAPAALEAYIALAGFFDKTSLTPIERQVVLLTVSEVNGCEFCVAAHSLISKKMVGMPESVVAAIRDHEAPADRKLAALWAFTVAVVEQRGWVRGSAELECFIAAGYTKEQALEVILGVTQKILSNYANHLLQTPLNAAFEAERWTAESVA